METTTTTAEYLKPKLDPRSHLSWNEHAEAQIGNAVIAVSSDGAKHQMRFNVKLLVRWESDIGVKDEIEQIGETIAFGEKNAENVLKLIKIIETAYNKGIKAQIKGL